MLNKNSKSVKRFVKYSGLFALAIYIIVGTTIVIANYHSLAYTISRHIGLSPVSMIIFALSDLVATTLLALNLFLHTRSRWNFGKAFVIYAAITVGCLAAVGLFPYSENVSLIVKIIHRFSAWFMISFTPIFVFIFLRRNKRKATAAFNAPLICFIAESILLAGFFVFAPEFFWQNSLILESIYLISLVLVTQVLAFAPNHLVKKSEQELI